MQTDAFDAYLLDLDGVVYVGHEALPGAPQAVAELRRRGKLVRFLTNDPRPTREDLAVRLTALGVPAEPEELITAGWATAAWLRREGVGSAYALGGPGLAAELAAAGIQVQETARPDAVVAGCDEGVDYAALHQAARHILAGARFVATNPDPWFPGQDGRRPATGAIVAALRAVTGRAPVVVGKPQPAMFEAALRGLPAGSRALVVGDSPDTDVAGAHRAGLPAVLVGAVPPHVAAGDPRLPDAAAPALSSLVEASIALPDRAAQRFPWPQSIAPGVAAVVFDGAGRLLLGRRADCGEWGLPSGHVEPGETVVEAVCREVREETGLEIGVDRLIGVYSDPTWQVFGYPSGEVVHFVTTCFACRVIGGSLQADGLETTEARFFDPGELPPDLLRMHPAWLRDALAGRTAPFVR
jgi:HAD superfamily hydrolase (TIGR01450 family)